MIQNEIRGALKQVCTVLDRNHVNCMVIGDDAVGFYGHQRISGVSLFQPEMKSDLDFWYHADNNNFISIVKSLYELGVETQVLENIVFDPKKTYLKNFILIFSQMEGLETHSDGKKRSRKETIDGYELGVIGLSDLITNKLAIGRKIDKTDIDHLKKL